MDKQQEYKQVTKEIFDALDTDSQGFLTVDDYIRFYKLFGVDKLVDTNQIATQAFESIAHGQSKLTYPLFEPQWLSVMEDIDSNFNIDIHAENLFSPAFSVILKLQNLQQRLQDTEKQEIQQIIHEIADGQIYVPNPQMLKAFITRFVSNDSRIVLDEYSELRRMSQRSSDEENSRFNLLTRMSSYQGDDSPLPVVSHNDLRISDHDFNIFNLLEQNDNDMVKTLLEIASKIYQNYNFYIALGTDFETYQRFINQIGQGYLDNSYHNALHAADVMQTSHIFLQTGQFIQVNELDVLEVFSLLISAAIHDFQHPGLNNNFLEKSRHPLAIKYNDISILENHHIAASFKIMQQDRYNILQEATPEEYRQIRRLIISCVLSTDMSKHQSHMAELSSQFVYDKREKIDRTLILTTLLHGADISNPVKPFGVYEQWASRVVEEFFLQGDKEKDMGFPVTPLFDRDTMTLPQSQVGFIKGVTLPYFVHIARAYPEMQYYVDNATNNCEEWLKRLV